MKKQLFLYFFLLFTSLYLSCQSDDYQLINNVDNSFYNQIKEYQSFDPEKLDEYYQYYKQGNSLIHSLNLVNHPHFYNTPSFYEALVYQDHYLVNKYYYLQEDYIPHDLIKVSDVTFVKRADETMMASQLAFSSYQQMVKDASFIGINLVLYSAYRSYEKQVLLYNNAENLNYIAYPGHSEHQTGCAFDISTFDAGLTNHFENTQAFLFLKDNAHQYGFIMRYPKNQEAITGYPYEPWHYRFVGSLAITIYENNLTLEEYWYNYIEITI